MISESSINKYEAMQKVKKTIESCKTLEQLKCAVIMFKNLVHMHSLEIPWKFSDEIRDLLDRKTAELKYQDLKCRR